MLDLMLAHHLMKALQLGTHLLLVGDIDQLPSVGAGDVLRDIIASGKFRHPDWKLFFGRQPILRLLPMLTV
jgi:ATP-dependent exoDNAse (exonuclease V) alpha subunit